MAKMIRQGDVLLIARDAPRKSTRTEALGLRVPGERTGHAHILPAEVHETATGTLLYVDEPTELTHDEHESVTVSPGWWEPRLQREFTPSSRPSRRAHFD